MAKRRKTASIKRNGRSRITASIKNNGRSRITASVGLYNELIAQANFAKDPNKIVFTPVMGKGPIDMVVLDLTTGEYQAYDVKSANYRKSEYTPKDMYKRRAGTLINRPLTDEQKKLKVKLFYNK